MTEGMCLALQAPQLEQVEAAAGVLFSGIHPCGAESTARASHWTSVCGCLLNGHHPPLLPCGRPISKSMVHTYTDTSTRKEIHYSLSNFYPPTIPALSLFIRVQISSIETPGPEIIALITSLPSSDLPFLVASNAVIASSNLKLEHS